MNYLSTAQEIVVMTPPILLAVTFHEFSHGWVANRLGDPTARLMGRLTLNPIKHLDFMGTLVFLLTRMIGWAKPVPVNHLNFRNPRQGMMWVGLAGPSANMILAGLSAIAYHVLKGMLGAKLIGGTVIFPLFLMVQLSVNVNVGLAIFNLIPIPPLDGSRILNGLLSPGQAQAYEKVERFGFLIILILLFTNVLEIVLYPIIRGVISLFLGS